MVRREERDNNVFRGGSVDSEVSRRTSTNGKQSLQALAQFHE